MALAFTIATPAIPEKSAQFRWLEESEKPILSPIHLPANLSQLSCLAYSDNVKPDYPAYAKLLGSFA
jgi:hypothetical protein